MSVVFKITPELRVVLKEPFGDLIKGSFSYTMGKMKDLVDKNTPPMIISVGDTVTRNLHEHMIMPKVSIVDNQCMRKKIPPVEILAEKVVYVKNPQGTITKEAILAVKEALESEGHVHIVVDGEEDLLTLASVVYAPLNALVVYGQPNEGMVVVKVTPEKKAQAAVFLKAMEIGSKS
jgi:uncharacterized protein (UPF0218 family)